MHVAARRLADGLRDMAVAGVELEGLLRVRFRVRARVGVRVRVRVRARVRATVRATVRVRDRDRVARPVSSWKACFSSSSYPSVWRQCCPLPWRMTWLRVRVRVRARVRVRVRVRVGVGVRVRARATVRELELGSGLGLGPRLADHTFEDERLALAVHLVRG